MTPLIFAGIALLFGLAATKAKAKASTTPALPAATPTKAKTSISVTTPSATKLKARQKVIRRKARRKAIKKITALAKSARARQALVNLIKTARSRSVPAATRRAARAKVAKIVAIPKTAKAAQLKKLPQPAKNALASAIAQSTTVKPTADQAARILSIWTKGGGNQGTKYNRSATVKRCQTLMGLTADGIIGPATRRRAKELGYTLAPRSAQKPGAVGGYDDILQYA